MFVSVESARSCVISFGDDVADGGFIAIMSAPSPWPSVPLLQQLGPIQNFLTRSFGPSSPTNDAKFSEFSIQATLVGLRVGNNGAVNAYLRMWVKREVRRRR